MARNRKSQPAAIRFGPALKAFLLCLLIGGSGVGYVWQQNQLLKLGRQKVEREKRLAQLRAQNSQLGMQWSRLQSQTAIIKGVEDLNAKFNLGLGPAQPGQVILLPDVLPASNLEFAGRRFAQDKFIGRVSP